MNEMSFIDKLMSRDLLYYLIEKTVRKRYVLSEKNVFTKQSKLLKHMLEYAKTFVPYYKGLDANDITGFPIISKQDLMNEFDAFCSIKKDKYSYSNSFTGGSTGEPLRVLNSGSLETDFGAKRWDYYGFKQGDLLLSCDGSKIDDILLKKSIYWKKKHKKDIPFGRYSLSSLYLNDDNAEIYCNYIKDLHPTFMRGYPSFIYSVACYAEKMNINLHFIKGIELTSEIAYPYQIQKMKEVYGAKIYLQYGHTESCVCAYTYDEYYRYRVEPLYGYVEVLDEHENHVKENEIGEVVVTSLSNFAMPLIRYRTGDYAEYGGKDNRYVYFNQVLGRTQDYIVNREGYKVILTALIFAQHFQAMDNISRWQLEQFEKGKVIAHIIKGEKYSSSDEKELTDLFNNSGNVELIFDYVEDIPLTPRGKSKMLVQHMEL